MQDNVISRREISSVLIECIKCHQHEANSYRRVRTWRQKQAVAAARCVANRIHRAARGSG